MRLRPIKLRPRRSAHAASRPSRSCARRSTSSRCRCGSSASTSPRSRAIETVGSLVVFEDAVAEEGALPQVRRTRARRAGRLRRDGRGRVAPLRAPRSPHGRGLRRVVRRRAEPRGHRRRQGPALRGDRRNAGVRPAARRGDRARQARRGGLRAGPVGSDRPRPSLAGAAAPAADPRRGSPVRARLPPAAPRRSLVRDRSSTRSRGSARRGGARSSVISARRSGSSRRPRRSSRACPSYRPRPLERSTRSCTRPDAGSRTNVLRTSSGKIDCRSRVAAYAVVCEQRGQAALRATVTVLDSGRRAPGTPARSRSDRNPSPVGIGAGALGQRDGAPQAFDRARFDRQGSRSGRRLWNSSEERGFASSNSRPRSMTSPTGRPRRAALSGPQIGQRRRARTPFPVRRRGR